MRLWLWFTCLTYVYPKKFVLLDPDAVDLEKSAANIKDAKIRSSSIRLAKFRKWLKYDVDCEFISREDLVVKIAQGRCPPEPEANVQATTTTTMKPKGFFFRRQRKPMKKIDKGLFSHENKESVIKAIVGNNKVQNFDWTAQSSPELELIGGSMVTFRCDEESRRKNKNEAVYIEWFVNGKLIKPSWFDWRVSISSDGKLGIWPIKEDDSGHFECMINGILAASVTVKVIPISTVLLNGLFNYLFVCGIFAVATISIGCFMGSRNQEMKELQVDRMEEFLAENVFKTDQMAKEKIIGIIEKQGVVNERELIEKSANSNRSTIMILLQQPKMKNLALKKKEADNNGPKNVLPSTDNVSGVSNESDYASTEAETRNTSRATTKESTETTGNTETYTVTKSNENETSNEKAEVRDDENDPEDSEESEDDEDKSSEAKAITSKGIRAKKRKAVKKTSKSNEKAKKKPQKAKRNTNRKKGALKGKGRKATKTSKAKGGGKKTKNAKKPAPKPTKKAKK